ncbi:MAG: phage portal protein [Actinomycetales bacterium]|nr:phage portal protein [Actinomycetales bacterium]
MSILDQWGNPTTPRRFAHAASRNAYRGVNLRQPDAGVDTLIPMGDRKTLSALSRRLVFNQGPAKEAIRQKASYSVGSAWNPIYNGEDAAAGQEAASWLRNVWFPLCDVRGGGHDWREFLEVVSKCMDRDGESFVLLTQSREGFPQLQHIPSYQVWSHSREHYVGGGKFRGHAIDDGVIYNKRDRPVAYRVNKDSDGKEFRDISSRDIIHVFDSEFPEQRRGFPAFSASLDDMKNSMTSSQLESVRQNIISSLYLVEKSSQGPDPDDPAWSGDIDTTNDEAVLYEQIAPGIRHISADQDIDVIKHENPGSVWSDFQDRILRAALAGMGWSYSLVIQPPGQGTACRAEVVRARKAVEARQNRLHYVAKRAATYALAKAGENPRYNDAVRVPGNMLRWTFSLPERLTVDDGREARAMREAVEKGLCSEQEYQAFKGRDYEDHVREQALAKVTRFKVAREVSETNDQGVEVSPEELGVHDLVFAPVSDQAIEEVDPSEDIAPEQDGDGDDPEPSRAATGLDVKEMLDAYGAAVRAGAITPQVMDEDHFRTLAGLPKLSGPAEQLWRKQGGTRSPITLASKGTPQPATSE